MSWNHRVFANEHKGEVYFTIHETYYNKKGIPNGYTESKTIGAEDIKGLRWTLNKMKEALEKPILSINNFPKEYKKPVLISDTATNKAEKAITTIYSEVLENVPKELERIKLLNERVLYYKDINTLDAQLLYSKCLYCKSLEIGSFQYKAIFNSIIEDIVNYHKKQSKLLNKHNNVKWISEIKKLKIK